MPSSKLFYPLILALLWACSSPAEPPAVVATANGDTAVDTAGDTADDTQADALADAPGGADTSATDTAGDADTAGDTDAATDAAASWSCDAATGNYFGCLTNAMAFPWCTCTAKGPVCMDHPEYQCPQVCVPGQKIDQPCPDGSSAPQCTCKAPPCQPVCTTLDGGATGWLNPCTGKLTPAACKGCPIACSPGWGKPQGWIDGCSGQQLWEEACEAKWDCAAAAPCKQTSCKAGQTATFDCKAGEQAPFCQCQPADGPCPPVCGYDASGAEGWVDSCSNAMIKLDKCMGCTASCDKIGSKSEGWYSSCNGLITWANCATGQWACKPEPWKGCVAIHLCKNAGEGWTEPGQQGQCCAGLVARDSVGWDGKTCSPVDCVCKVCLACGDGTCDGKENPCNCPEDCGKP